MGTLNTQLIGQGAVPESIDLLSLKVAAVSVK